MLLPLYGRSIIYILNKTNFCNVLTTKDKKYIIQKQIKMLDWDQKNYLNRFQLSKWRRKGNARNTKWIKW